MIQIKKTILTLVALLAVTTQAWAQEETLLTTITPTAKEQASYSTANVATVSFSYTADGSSAYLANWGWWGYGWIATVTAAEGYTITKCKFYDDADRTATDSEAPFVVETTEEDKTPRINGTPIDGGNMWSKGIKKIEVYGYVTPAASSGPEVAWDKAKNTGTFKMPAGNVTLAPEYYPQAALTAAPTAINDVPATTDGAIVKAGTVANIGSTETAQGTVMYYVSPTALDDAALLALAADQWTADVPTAEKLTKGEAYVYYYVRGNDSDTDEENFSDGDILSANALTVTIAAEPTYDVTYAEGTQDADKWTVKAGTDGSFQSLPLKGVKAGTKVKLKYDGDRSMLKGVTAVKVEKKAAPATITVTWNNDDITGSGNSFTKGDVTITADMIDFHQKDFMMGGTFTTTLGNFTKIEVTGSKWDASGTGWSGSTWTGNASSVSYNGSIRGDGMGTIKFVFTIEAKKAAYEHSITIAVDPSTTGHIATAPAMTIEFNTGETWADVAARYDWLDTYDIYTVFYKDKDNILNGNVYDANGGVTPDKTIDPNGSYHWGPQ